MYIYFDLTLLFFVHLFFCNRGPFFLYCQNQFYINFQPLYLNILIYQLQKNNFFIFISKSQIKQFEFYISTIIFNIGFYILNKVRISFKNNVLFRILFFAIFIASNPSLEPTSTRTSIFDSYFLISSKHQSYSEVDSIDFYPYHSPCLIINDRFFSPIT